MQAKLFERERSRLKAIAYRMLGSVSDAEDAVQDAWLRYCLADRSRIAETSRWLVRVLVRICIDRLRAAKRSREHYVGPWLPEPVLEWDIAASAPDRNLELADDLAVAFLLALERLSPVERAVFVLREVFGTSHAEVATILGKSEAACRQIAARARRHLNEARPRYPIDQDHGGKLTAAFLDALKQGDESRLAAMLRNDAVLLSDGGGKAPAALRPILGAEKIVRLLLALVRKEYGRVSLYHAWINGLPGFVVAAGGHLTTVALEEDEVGRISAIYSVRNPDKLRHVTDPSNADAGTQGRNSRQDSLAALKKIDASPQHSGRSVAMEIQVRRADEDHSSDGRIVADD